jgi:hypothetical protein
MKKLLTLLLLVIALHAQSQVSWSWDNFITFDSGGVPYHSIVTIDTTYAHNQWQIGRPQKPYFDSGYLSRNAIVTDTAHSYAPGDTSVFFIRVRNWQYLSTTTQAGAFWGIEFMYKYVADTSSIAKVEVSVDNGSHWINPLDTLLPYWTWPWSVPNFKTPDTNWQSFSLACGAPFPADSVVFRFTFVGGADSTLPGWIIDNINLKYAWESVPQLRNDNLITLYPNPSHGNLFIHSDKPDKDATITIYNTLGQQVYSAPAPTNNYINFDLPNGIYTLRYSDKEEYCVKQIVISN